jgi:hypothetical protein
MNITIGQFRRVFVQRFRSGTPGQWHSNRTMRLDRRCPAAGLFGRIGFIHLGVLSVSVASLSFPSELSSCQTANVS